MRLMNLLSSLLLTVAVTGCITPKTLGAAGEPEQSFAIRNVRIFDGERVISSGTVVVRGERIAAVGEEVDLSGVAEVIDGRGQTLLPGLVDAHFHPDGPDAYRTSLALGVTTVIDLFGEYSSAILKTSLRDVANREADEADALVSLFITVPGGHGTQYGEFPKPVATSQECRAQINTQLDAGAAFVKIVYDVGESWSVKPMPTLSRQILADCIQAAHDRGVLAVVHAWTLRESREAVEAGADVLTHGIIDTPPDQAYAALLAARGVFMIPTLAVAVGIASRHNDEELLADPRLVSYLPPKSLDTLKSTFDDGFGQGMKPTVLQETIRLLKAARVPLLAGSDAANPQTAPGATLHQELELLVATGLTPTEALAGATSLSAAGFRLSDRGRIAPGLRADLLLVQGDPTTDIRMTRNIVAVWKRGKKLNREAYRTRVVATHQADVKP